MQATNDTAAIRAVFPKKDFISKVKMLNKMPLNPVILPFTNRCNEVQIPMSNPPINARHTSELFQYIINYLFYLKNILYMF